LVYFNFTFQFLIYQLFHFCYLSSGNSDMGSLAARIPRDSVSSMHKNVNNQFYASEQSKPSLIGLQLIRMSDNSGRNTKNE
jgi:hypothetical protein